MFKTIKKQSIRKDIYSGYTCEFRREVYKEVSNTFQNTLLTFVLFNKPNYVIVEQVVLRGKKKVAQV